jgi:hypothetical protein
VGVHLRFDTREPAVGGAFQADLERGRVAIVIEAPALGNADAEGGLDNAGKVADAQERRGDGEKTERSGGLLTGKRGEKEDNLLRGIILESLEVGWSGQSGLPRNIRKLDPNENTQALTGRSDGG